MHRFSCIQLAPTGSRSLLYSLSHIQNPTEMCEKIYSLIKDLTCQVRQYVESKLSEEGKRGGGSCS